MKTKFLNLVILITLILIAVSCKKDESSRQAKIDLTKELGKTHNASLEFVYSGLIHRKSLKSTMTAQDLMSATIEESEAYMVNVQHCFIEQVEEVYSQAGVYEVETTMNDEILLQTTMTKINNLQDVNYKSMIFDILEVLKNDSLNYQDFDQKMDQIDAKSTGYPFSPEIRAITDVARYSYQYWEQNLDKWLLLVPQQRSSNTKIDPRFWDIMESDVQGAVGGALGGGLVGALIGAPVCSGITGIFIAIKAKK